MDRLTTIDAYFSIEVLDRNSRSYDLLYHKEIDKYVESIDYIIPVIKDSSDLFHAINLPIVQKEPGGKVYRLVARYWVFRYLVDHNITKFPALVFEGKNTDKLTEAILELVRLENGYFTRKAEMSGSELEPLVTTRRMPKPLKRKKKVTKSSSSATNGRRDARESGRRCPFCPGPLSKATGTYNDPQGDLLNQDGSHRISCGYKTVGRYNCSFVATLTEVEFNDFTNKKIKFPTEEWLALVPDKVCPECGDQVYKRTIHKERGKVEIWERCRKFNMSRDNNCCWKKRIR